MLNENYEKIVILFIFFELNKWSLKSIASSVKKPPIAGSTTLA